MDRSSAERWKNRLGGTVAVASLLLFPAVSRWLQSERVSAWALALVVPAGFVGWMLLELLLGRPFRALSARLTAWSIRPGARRHVELFRSGGVPLLLHWSFFALPVALLPATILWPAGGGALLGASSLGVLVHELGHVVAARHTGCRVEYVALLAMHGQTAHSAPATERASILIAWGGVLAQVALAVPSWALLYWAPPAGLPTRILLMTLGPYSLAVAAVNLLPLAGLDGAVAWRILRRTPRARPTVVRFPR